MCFSGGSSSSSSSAAQSAETDKQIAAQQQMSAASLAQARSIADEQNQFNQDQFDYTKAQDAKSLQDSKDQATRQSVWDATRAGRATVATQQISDAFSQFSPRYFDDYKNAYYNQADSEIQRQFGLSEKDMTFGLARAGQLAGSNAADQQGKLIETKGRAEIDQANTAADKAEALRQSVATAQNSLTQQALSSDTLGSPIAPGNDASVSAQIDTANRAVSTLSDNAKNYTASIKPVDPSLGTLSGIFTGALTGVANAYSGAQDARIASGAYGGANVNATGLGGSSTRIY